MPVMPDLVDERARPDTAHCRLRARDGRHDRYAGRPGSQPFPLAREHHRSRPGAGGHCAGFGSGAARQCRGLCELLLTQALAACSGSITDDLILRCLCAGLNDIVANLAAYGLVSTAPPVLPTGLCDASQAFFGTASTSTTVGYQVMARSGRRGYPETGYRAAAFGLFLGLAVTSPGAA